MIPSAISIKYMLAGYGAIFIILVLYLVSLFLRWRKLNQDLKMLSDLDKQQ